MPLAQGVHARALALDAVPAAHSVTLAPSAHAEPAGHAVQELVSPGRVMYSVNCGQDRVGATHSAALAAPWGAAVPEGHGKQADAPCDSTYVLAGHGAHWVPPDDPWKDPGAQL